MITNISRPREAIAVASLGSAFVYIAGGYDGHKYLTGDFNICQYIFRILVC